MHVLRRLCSLWVKVIETEMREAFIENIFVENAIDLLIPECFVSISFQFFCCSENTWNFVWGAELKSFINLNIWTSNLKLLLASIFLYSIETFQSKTPCILVFVFISERIEFIEYGGEKRLDYLVQRREHDGGYLSKQIKGWCSNEGNKSALHVQGGHKKK